jgi:hypothetical protein
MNLHQPWIPNRHLISPYISKKHWIHSRIQNGHFIQICIPNKLQTHSYTDKHNINSYNINKHLESIPTTYQIDSSLPNKHVQHSCIPGSVSKLKPTDKYQHVIKDKLYNTMKLPASR